MLTLPDTYLPYLPGVGLALLTKHLPSLFDIHLIYLLPYVKSTYLYGANFTYLARSCLAYLNSLLYLMRFILTLTWFDLTLLARHAPSLSDAYYLPGAYISTMYSYFFFRNMDHLTVSLVSYEYFKIQII